MHCSKCNTEKDAIAFPPSKRNRRSDWCSECRKSYARERWAEDPSWRRKSWLRKYKMSIAEYDVMLSAQGNACANQGCKETSREFHVDHDHACCSRKHSTCGDCVRGILCSCCNQALGNLSDSTEKIQGLLDYLVPKTFAAGMSAALLQSAGRNF